VKVWDLETRKITRRLRGQDGWIWCLEQFGDSGDLLLTGATDGAVRLWDQRTGEQARVLPIPHRNPNSCLKPLPMPAGDVRHRSCHLSRGPAHRRAACAAELLCFVAPSLSLVSLKSIKRRSLAGAAVHDMEMYLDLNRGDLGQSFGIVVRCGSPTPSGHWGTASLRCLTLALYACRCTRCR